MPFRSVLLLSILPAAVAESPVRAADRPLRTVDPAEAAEDAMALPSGVAVRPWKFIVIHHSGTDQGSVAAIHREHRSRRDRSGRAWLGIGYHFVIGNGHGMADGQISSTFRWKQQLHGAHSGSLPYNDRGIGICLIGNFEKSPPTSAQVASVSRLIGRLTREYGIPSDGVIGHNQVRPTACPGRFFPFQEVLQRSRQRTAVRWY